MSKARELSKLPNYVLSTVAELKLAVGKEQGDKAFIGGYYADGDGGGGDFYWDAVSVEADNSGTIFQVTGTATGRWKRIYSGAVDIKWFGAIGNGIIDDFPKFVLARTLAGINGVVKLSAPATYYFAGSRPDLSGVGIYAEPNVTIKIDENPNTKTMQLLSPVTIQNTVHGTTITKSSNTNIQLPELFNIAPSLVDLAINEVSSIENFTTWLHKIYQPVTGDISTINGTGTVTSLQVTWASDFSGNPQLIYPASLEDGSLFEINALNTVGVAERVGVFTKTSSRVWFAYLVVDSGSLFIYEFNLSGTLISSSNFAMPNGGAYGWVVGQEVNIGFVVNGTITTMVVNGLPIFKFPSGSTYSGFIIDNNPTDATKITLKDPIKTTNYRARLKNNLNIGVIGDSISYGAWCSNDIVDLLPKFIENLPDIGKTSVSNYAVSGTTSSYWASSATDYSTHDIVLCMIGTNDVQGNVAVSTYVTNLTTIANNIIADGATPIFGIFPIFTTATNSGVTGVTTINYANHARYTHALKKFCIQNGYNFADMRRNFGANIIWYNDNIHPTLAGQISIASSWTEALYKYQKNKTGNLL